jgi:glycosyltransferase involved in cell wall biosynthesis
MSNKKDLVVNLISKRMPIHAAASGYDRLADFLTARVIHPDSQWTSVERAVVGRLRFLVDRSGSMWYNRDSLYSELRAARQWFRRSGQIFHFLYGENSHRYLGNLKFKGRRNFIVCTYHTPADKFRVVVQDKNHLARIDAVIVVSRSQVEFFSELVGLERVSYVPHGIDVDYFRPKKRRMSQGGGVRCLFVGIHLRDFETMARSAQILNRCGKDIHFAVVTYPKFHHYFQGIDNVELYAGISDEKLLGLYQDTDIFVCPLLGSTANNSLLEAMACGLPIVSTDLPGVRDYMNDDCSLLTPARDPQALAEAVLCLGEDQLRRRQMALAGRVRSMDFNWQKIASKTRDIYERFSA